MKQKEGTFTAAQGTQIYYQYWQPEQPARAVILLVHGAGEHCARYQHVAEFFVDKGYAVAGFDHPGHGRSEGERCFINKFDDFLDALGILHQQVKDDFPAVPLVLLGHSLGGLISCRYLLDQQGEFGACMLCGPAIKTEPEPGFLQMSLIRCLSMLAPKIGALQLDANGVSRDPEVVKRYKQDPLVHTGKLSARLVEELLKAMTHVQANAGNLQLPMLMLHGEKDSMASPEGSRYLHANIGSERKEMKIYPGLFHEILNEPEREQVMQDMFDWLQTTLDSGAAGAAST